jgi:LacI family transcriptional regulator
MRDVAALAGVSIKTVSRVVNSEPNVSPELAERVRGIADKLHYVPNASAANLARAAQDTQSIALLAASMGHPFWAAVFRGVEEVAHSRRVAVFGASTDEDADTEERLITAFASRRVDGLIIGPTGQDHRRIASLMSPNLMAVYVDRAPLGIAADVVTTDNRQAAHNATEHLLAGGHRRIALLTDNASISTAVERLSGYKDALGAARLPVDTALIRQNMHEVAAAEAAVRELLSSADPPTAIFASQNQSVIGSIRALRSLGLSHQVALVGMDDVELADLVDPPLTVMRQDPVEIGRVAAQRLFARLDGGDPPPQQLVVPAELVIRGSGEIPPPGTGGALA